MYSTYAGAKRRAKELHATLREIDVRVGLHDCQRAIAKGGGYRDWPHLQQTLGQGQVRPAETGGFIDRASLTMPDLAVAPTRRWVDATLSSLREGEAPFDRHWGDWYAKISEVVTALSAIHFSTTPALRPGSGPGMRLRVELVGALLLGPSLGQLDRTTFTLTYDHSNHALFGRHGEHRHFARELERLRAEGIIEFIEGGRLILHPPSLDLVKTHIAACRISHAEYWREQAAEREAAV